MYMLNPDLLQVKTNDIQTSQWARAPGPGPKKSAWDPARSHVFFFGARARGPGPLTILKIFHLEFEEIWVEHIHIAPQRGYVVRVNKY